MSSINFVRHSPEGVFLIEPLLLENAVDRLPAVHEGQTQLAKDSEARQLQEEEPVLTSGPILCSTC